MSLQSLLLQEYQSHPAFRFEKTTLLLEKEKADAFNDAYRRIVRYATVLSTSAFQQVSQACSESLTAVFWELRSQTSDVLERRFLDELMVHAGQLLRTEIDFLRLKVNGQRSILANEAALDYADRLTHDHYLFGCLDNATLDEILVVAKSTIAGLRVAAAEGARTRDALSVTSGPVIRDICRLLNRDFGDKGVLDAVSAYVGCRMRVSGAALELSISQSGWWNSRLGTQVRAPRTLYAHLDESIGHPKSIVYLSDVGPEQGPTCVYSHVYQNLATTPLQELVGRILNRVGESNESPLHSYYARDYHQTMSSENFRQHYMRLPDAMRFNSHFGWDVLPGGKVEEYLVSSEQQMLGPPGTFVVFDGARLLHRGGLMNEGERIALQVIFSDSNLGRKIMSRLKKGFAG